MYDSVTPETDKLPEPWDGKLNMLQKLCVLRAFRPDLASFPTGQGLVCKPK